MGHTTTSLGNQFAKQVAMLLGHTLTLKKLRVQPVLMLPTLLPSLVRLQLTVLLPLAMLEHGSTMVSVPRVVLENTTINMDKPPSLVVNHVALESTMTSKDKHCAINVQLVLTALLVP
jgi:hypothetical protein